jgi:hypothetical protein
VDYLLPIIPSIETISPKLAQIAVDVSEKKSKIDYINREILSLRNVGEIQPKQFKMLKEKERKLLSEKKEIYKTMEILRKIAPRGFFFQEQLWNLTLNILLTKRKDRQIYISELQIGICDSSGNPQEDVEIAFTQGRKVIERFMTQKGISFIKRLDPQKFHVKFKQYGIYLGQATLNLKGNG